MNVKNINGKWQIVSGAGGEGVWIGQYVSDGPVTMTPIVAPGAGGNGPCWLGELVMMDRFKVGLETCYPDGGFPLPLNVPAATSYGASDDSSQSWAYFLADGVTGVQASWGLKLPMMRWLGMGPALFVTPQSGDAIVCYTIGGLGRWVEKAVAIDFYAVDADTVMWTDGARRIQVRNLPPPAQVESAFSPSTFEALGRRWLVTGRQNGGFVVRPWDDATKGFIVVAEGLNAFGPCAVMGDRPQDVITFWSDDAGEVRIFAKTIDLSGPMQPLTQPVIVPAFQHAIACGVAEPSR